MKDKRILLVRPAGRADGAAVPSAGDALVGRLGSRHPVDDIDLSTCSRPPLESAAPRPGARPCWPILTTPRRHKTPSRPSWAIGVDRGGAAREYALIVRRNRSPTSSPMSSSGRLSRLESAREARWPCRSSVRCGKHLSCINDARNKPNHAGSAWQAQVLTSN